MSPTEAPGRPQRPVWVQHSRVWHPDTQEVMAKTHHSGRRHSTATPQLLETQPPEGQTGFQKLAQVHSALGSQSLARFFFILQNLLKQKSWVFPTASFKLKFCLTAWWLGPGPHSCAAKEVKEASFLRKWLRFYKGVPQCWASRKRVTWALTVRLPSLTTQRVSIPHPVPLLLHCSLSFSWRHLS